MQLTIRDSQELFPPEVIPQFCGFEGQGQHIQKYRDVQSQHPDSRVFLAAGADLQMRRTGKRNRIFLLLSIIEALTKGLKQRIGLY